MILLINLSIYFSLMFLFLNHPLSMGSILLIQTIIISVLTSNFHNNFWFSYILFLIMVSGMLIMFIYMTSIAANEKFKMMKLLNMLFIIIIIMSMIMLILMKSLFFFKMTYFYEMFNFKFHSFYLNKFYNYPNSITLIIFMIYLLFSLMVVMKICMNYSNPLRQK